MIFLKILAKFIKVLRSGEDPRQIAGGCMLGMMLGLLTFKTLFAAPLLLILILVNVNLAAAIVGLFIFRLIGYLADPLLHSLGYWVLADIPGLKGFWTALASMRIVPFTRFNNTLIMGGLIAAAVLAIPLFWGVKRLINGYREGYQERVQNWKIIKILKGSALFRFLSGVEKLGGR
jgi:uncharacterized protein (TIGR03546 family)